jgi:hypothetical protein
MSLPPPLNVRMSGSGSSLSAAGSWTVAIGTSNRPRIARFA